MQKPKIINLRKSRFSEILAEGYSFFLMFAAFVAGMIIGVTLLGQNAAVSEKAASLFAKYSAARDNKPFPSVLFSSFFGRLWPMLAVFACGTSVVGAALTPVAVGFSGFYYGILAGYIYSQYSLGGIIYTLILIIPPAFIGAFALLFAANGSFRLSLTLASSALPDPKPEYIYAKLLRFCKTFLFLLLLTFLSALTDSLLSLAFAETVGLT